MESIEVLRTQSIMIIGNRNTKTDRISFDSLHDATNKTDEEELRHLLSKISQHINKSYIHSESARKFMDGKLMYVERASTEEGYNEIYCLFTHELNINNHHKKTFKSITARGGIYSARRFFSEMMDMLDENVEIEDYSDITVEEAVALINNYDLEKMNINTMGRLISFISHTGTIDPLVLENLYYIIYETIQTIENQESPTDDPDEFLDAAFLIANFYESHTYHLSLELYKKIYPMAIKNDRSNLEAACRLRLCAIYMDKYPDSGELMLEQLDSFDKTKFKEMTKRNLETYYVMLGHAHYELLNFDKAAKNYEKAIEIASNSISSPSRIAEAYSALASMNYRNFNFKESSRQYLTASTLSFSNGDVARSNKYLEQASLPDIYTSLTFSMTALDHRMKDEANLAEFKAWEGLRMLVKAYIHSMHGDMFPLMDTTERILDYATSILSIPGKKRTNLRIIRSIRKLLDNLIWNRFAQGEEEVKINRVMSEIEKYLPLPAPIFMLLARDGRLITMGEVQNSGYERSRVKGVILSGIISAITSLISEVGERDSMLKHIDAGNFQIMLEQGTYTITALLVDRVTAVFRSRLSEINSYIETEYCEVLKQWNGTLNYFDQLNEKVVQNFSPENITKYL